MEKNQSMTRGFASKKNFLDVAELIRSIQRAEGNPDCFGRVEGDCDQRDCAWRLYCLEKDNTFKMNHNKTDKDAQG
jgi:hypothetical protein